MGAPTILIFSVPFRGHLNVLLPLATNLRKLGAKVKLVICGWQDTQLPSDLLSYGTHIIRAQMLLTSSSALEFNVHRMKYTYALLDQFVGGYATNIDAIIYDFFVLEAALVAKKRKIQAICSIPAVPFTQQEARLADSRVKEWLITNKADGGEMIVSEHFKDILPLSDGFGLAGDINLVWASPNLLHTRSVKIPNAIYMSDPVLPTSFFRKWTWQLKLAWKPHGRLIYMNLGSIVTGNMLRQHPAYIEPLAELYKLVITKILDDSCYDMLVCIPDSKEVFEWKFKEDLAWFKKYKDRFEVVGWVDQLSVLKDRRPAMFVSHGGGNSLREAITASVPLFVIPFFGDQLCTANMAQSSGIGQSLQLEFADSDSDQIDMHKRYLSQERQGSIREGLGYVMDNVHQFRRTIWKLKWKDQGRTHSAKTVYDFIRRRDVSE